MGKTIRLMHGSGGKQANKLIRDLFLKHFNNPVLENMSDAAHLSINNMIPAMTTDSFVVNPLSFPGGDIGKLAVCGTVNDLAVSGASPAYLSAAFIIEEGFPIEQLEQLVRSMAESAREADILIVCGDTKVVEKGKCDKLFINTTGLGYIEEGNNHLATGEKMSSGDKILINGTIGDHGMAVMATRNNWAQSNLPTSDCAPLNKMIAELLDECKGIRFMRDATRGGVAGVLYEIIFGKSFGIVLDEKQLPIDTKVKAMCEVLGFEPLTIANEGKVIVVIDEKEAERAIEIMKSHPYGRNAVEIGQLQQNNHNLVVMKLISGVTRIIPEPEGELLPRIC